MTTVSKQQLAAEGVNLEQKCSVQSEQQAQETDFENLIDMNIFDQLLDMDDEEDHEFSFNIVNNYFEQAVETFKNMDEALDKRDLPELSRLGHFLKGSSAAIGLKQVQATCEKIQHIGNCQDEQIGNKLNEKDALKKLTQILPRVKQEYIDAEQYLKSFYEQDTR
ncbi:signal transduction histidine kinase [Dichotomocladium elegans]|nr:signal transduction histidine kinase [Dichotomocladium elegans]